MTKILDHITTSKETAQQVMNVWLKVHRERDSNLIEQTLNSEFNVYSSDSFDPEKIDICIIDHSSWTNARKQIQSIRKAQDPLTVPTLLLVNKKHVNALSHYTLEQVNEILNMPMKADIFKLRLQNLRQIRQDSLRLHKQNYDLKQFREAMEAANSGIIITDNTQPENPIIYANQAFEEITGYSRMEARGRNCRFLQADDRDQDALKTLRESLKKGQPCRISLRNYTKQGNLFWNELKIAPIRDQEGNITHFVGVQNDITDQVEARRKLEEKERQWSALVNRIPDSVVISTGHEGKIEYVNQAAARMYGIEDPRELVGHTILELVHESPDYERIKENLRKAMAGQEIPLQSLTIKNMKGDDRRLELRSTPIRFKNKPAVLTLSRDITEKYKTRQKLNREYHKFSQLFENDPAGIAECEPDGTIQSVNPAFEEMFGYKEEELVGENLDRMLTNTEDERREAKLMTQSHRQGYPQLEVIRYDRHGNSIPVLVGGAPIREDGKIVKFYAIYVDISDQKELEKENKKRLEQERTLRSKAESSRSKFKSMFHTAPSAICLLEGPQHRFTYVNKSYRELFRKKEFVGHTVKQVFPEIESQGLLEILDEVYENKEPFFAEKKLIELKDEEDGSWYEKYLDFVYKPMLNADGDPYGIFVEAIDVTGEVRYRQELQERFREKETLLEEIHHRVKNNMAVISGLLFMQAEDTENENARHVLKDSLSRIQSMSLVHEQLYQQSEDESAIYMDRYLPRLAETIERSQGNKEDNITLEIESEHICLPLPQSVPVGLITSELLINVYKHAFEGRDEGTIRIVMKKRENNIELSVSDNGVGLPEDFSMNTTSLGMQIIQNLAEQVDADISYTSEKAKGTAFKVTLTGQSAE